MLIREAEPNDANQLVKLIEEVEKSNFMLFKPGERQTTPEQMKMRIESMKKEETSTMLVAEANGSLVGYLFIIGGSPSKSKHSVYLVIGISENFRGQGVGSQLFEKLDEWAKEHQIHRIELTVMVHNTAGIALYQKMGFEIEGTKKHSLFMDGKYVDEYYMAKLI